MSRSNCASCMTCKKKKKNYCDNCDICQENMKDHRELFYLGDQFFSKTNYAEKELSSKAEQVKNNLSEKYNININQNTRYLDQCEKFVSMMKYKYNDINDLKYSLNYQIKQERKNFENDLKNLSNKFDDNLKNIRDSFEKEKKTIINEIEKENDRIKPLIKSKNELEEEKEKIEKINADEIANNYVNGKKNEIENDYQNKKNLIDEENQFKEEILEYTEEEKTLENNYLNIINGIKKYSNKIPYFDNWIEVYKLKKYIN